MLYVRRLISLANPRGVSGVSGCCKSSSSVELYNMNSIGESGEPCGTPAVSWWGAVSVPLTMSVVVRFVRNDWTTWTSYGGTPFFLKVFRRRRWFTVLKALAMSSERTEAT